MHISIHYCNANIRSWFMVLILQSGAIMPLQRKIAKRATQLWSTFMFLDWICDVSKISNTAS